MDSSNSGLNPFDGADLIHVYTRENALADGVLVDVSETAREAGINWPVAVSAAAFGQYVEVPHGVFCQDEAGRLWDVVYMLSLALRALSRRGNGHCSPGDEIAFALHVRNDNRERTPPLV